MKLNCLYTIFPFLVSGLTNNSGISKFIDTVSTWNSLVFFVRTSMLEWMTYRLFRGKMLHIDENLTYKFSVHALSYPCLGFMEDQFGPYLLTFSANHDTQMRFQSRSLMDYIEGRIYHAYFVVCHYRITDGVQLELYDPPSFPLLDNAHLVSIFPY